MKNRKQIIEQTILKVMMENKTSLEENKIKTALLSAAIGVAGGIPAGIIAPHIAQTRTEISNAAGNPAGLGTLNKTRQTIQDKIGLGENDPVIKRASIGAGFGALSGLIGSRIRRRS